MKKEKTFIDGRGFEVYKPYHSACSKCKHFDATTYSCPAFPKLIPDRFLNGAEVHNKVTPDQIGELVLTPRILT